MEKLVKMLMNFSGDNDQIKLASEILSKINDGESLRDVECRAMLFERNGRVLFKANAHNEISLFAISLANKNYFSDMNCRIVRDAGTDAFDLLEEIVSIKRDGGKYVITTLGAVNSVQLRAFNNYSLVFVRDADILQAYGYYGRVGSPKITKALNKYFFGNVANLIPTAPRSVAGLATMSASVFTSHSSYCGLRTG